MNCGDLKIFFICAKNLFENAANIMIITRENRISFSNLA